MTTAMATFERIPGGLPRSKQPRWEIPVALRDLTFLVEDYSGGFADGKFRAGPLLTPDLREWVFRNMERLDQSIFLVGEHAQEAAAALVLDLARQPHPRGQLMYQKYVELIGWTDQDQLSNRSKYEEYRDWLVAVNVLVTELGDPADKYYNRNQQAVLETRIQEAQPHHCWLGHARTPGSVGRHQDPVRGADLLQCWVTTSTTRHRHGVWFIAPPWWMPCRRCRRTCSSRCWDTTSSRVTWTSH